jgi:hypothetical protein
MSDAGRGGEPVVATAARSRRGRSPAFVYSGLSAVLIVLIAALTITASQTAPPAIAELAPAAVEQIKDAPPSQSSTAGEGDGGAGTGDPPPSTTTTAAAVATLPPEVRTVPRTRQCVGSPPRQTEDPQSPPCVPLWEGTDNGGATSKGVTRDSIKVAVVARDNDGQLTRQDKALEAYFNKRFEMYGRKLTLVPYTQAPNFTTGDKMEGDAVIVDEQIGAFASLAYGAQQGQEQVYFDALARRGIISVATSFLGPNSSAEADLAKHAPYEWSYYAPIDLIQKNLAEIICKQLVAKPPSFAGGSQAIAPTRQFGMIIDGTVRGAKPVTGEPLLALTRRCGAVWDVHVIDPPPPTTPDANVNGTKEAMTQMQGNGVTTIVCICFYNYLLGAMQNANVASPSYQPEFIVQSYGVQDVDFTVAGAWPEPASDHVLGMRSLNKVLPRPDMPYWRAAREVDPTYPEGQHNVDTKYWDLLLLASGIQLAGPSLTPQTFEQGLQRAKFPNPGCGKAPAFQACVGFDNGTHTMIKDFSMIWWDPNGRSIEEDYTKSTNALQQARGQGSYCYADLGTRHALGTWPAGDAPVFGNRPCR